MKDRNAFAALQDNNAPDDDLPVDEIADSVLVDALVVLKIASYARDSPNTQVTGALLGFDIEQVLEITWCYPYLDDDQDQDQYQFDMMKALRDVNVDSNNVGWFHVAPLGSFVNSSWLNILHEFQTSIANSVVLEYDPVRSATGSLTLKAYRLTDAFLEFYKGKDPATITTDALLKAGLNHSNIFKELPLRIRNSHLLSALMHELEVTSATPIAPNLDVLAPKQTQYLEKNIDALLDSIEDYSQDQNKYQYWVRQTQRERSRIEMQVSRKRYEDPDEAEAMQRQLSAKLPVEPSRLDSLLVTQQIVQQCQQIVDYVEPSLTRLETNAKILAPPSL
ncbi:hypothetical protein RI367_002462 [Sorochytrium milnesiophthora]